MGRLFGSAEGEMRHVVGSGAGGARVKGAGKECFGSWWFARGNPPGVSPDGVCCERHMIWPTAKGERIK